MQVTTKAIVLTSLKYGDTSLIVRAFTLSDGLKSYLLKGILTAKKGKLKSAYFQPLTQLEIVATHRNKGTLESIREAKVAYPYASLYSDMAKNTMTLFLAEMLANSIQEEERNDSMYDYLEASLQWLDTHWEISNFHICFLLTFTKYLGFYPGSDNHAAKYFNLLEGEFTDHPSMDPMLHGQNLDFFKRFMDQGFEETPAIKMSKSTRQELLTAIILYYELHIQGFRRPRSLSVLHQVFA